MIDPAGIIRTIASGLARPHGIFVAEDGTVFIGDSEESPDQDGEVGRLPG